MKTVLIVDDDAPTQQLLSALMRRNGLGSVIASNGAEAIKLLNAEDFAVIILDLMMPAVGGQEVIDYLAGENKDTPVIVCTAAGPRRTESIDKKAVRAIVRKPFDIEELTNIVDSIVKGEGGR